MPKPIDAIMPVLQRIQADLAEVRKDIQRVDRKVDTVSADVRGVSDRMDAFEDYFTYTMGLTSQNKADIARLRKELQALKPAP
jgi:septal ring factor EnvC (AmiA/AmiB activator)